MAIKDLKTVRPVACYLTHEQYAEFKKISAETGASLAWLLRAAAADFLARRGKRTK